MMSGVTQPLPISIRPPRFPDDAERLAALFAETARWHAEQFPADFRLPDMSGLIEEFRREPPGSACLLVAETDDRIVGVVTASVSEAPAGGLHKLTGKIAHIGDIVVDSGARRHGIGRALMRAAQDWASGSGAATVVLNVHPGNAAAHELYRGLGFRDFDLRMRLDLE